MQRWSVSIIVIIFLIFLRFLCSCSLSFWSFHISSGNRQSIMQIDCSFKLNPMYRLWYVYHYYYYYYYILIIIMDLKFELKRKAARRIVKRTHLNFNFRYIHIHDDGGDDDDNNRVIHGSHLFLYTFSSLIV